MRRFDPTQVELRRAGGSDIAALVELNRIAYPELVPFDFVWRPDQLVRHQIVFPEGQRVAVLEGRVVGAIALLQVSLGPEPFPLHTWAEITGHGSFDTHDPTADTLYVADIYVHPDARGRGVAAALHGEQRALCRKLRLRRLIAGGRLWCYWQYADRMAVEEYAARVVAGELRDPVLSCQLRDGYELRGILPGYLPDPRGLDHASYLEWLNPDHASVAAPAIGLADRAET